MLNMKRFVIPVNIGATGIVTKGLNICKQYQESIQQILYRKNSCTGDIAHNKKSDTRVYPKVSGLGR
jgi:hypothetical protein